MSNHLEDSPSGLWRTPGTRVGLTPSGVQIPHPPPVKEPRRSGGAPFVCPRLFPCRPFSTQVPMPSRRPHYGPVSLPGSGSPCTDGTSCLRRPESPSIERFFPALAFKQCPDLRGCRREIPKLGNWGGGEGAAEPGGGGERAADQGAGERGVGGGERHGLRITGPGLRIEGAGKRGVAAHAGEREAGRGSCRTGVRGRSCAGWR